MASTARAAENRPGPARRKDGRAGENWAVSLVVFVINRTLLRDPRRFAQRCRAAAEDRGWKPWFAPAPEPVSGRALAAGADLVVAAGGDGTVRACAEALAGTGVPLALVPLGTANLVARALGVPAQAGRALEVAFGGRDRLIDLGRVTGTGGASETGRDAGTGVEAGAGNAGVVFAAMAGIGLDAAVVGAAWPRVKRRLGWMAYAVAAVPRLGWPASDFTIRVDEAAPLRRRARCVVVANAGLLPGGFTLLPAARLDDGLLDVGILAPAGGWDWLRLGGHVLGGQVLGGEVLGIEGGRGRRVLVSADRVLPRQADGEVLVPGRTLGASVTPGALVLRLAR
jgi:diacylglycerol kinase family enzyme